jgi:hypothetical protein
MEVNVMTDDRTTNVSASSMKPLSVPVKTARELLGIGNTKMWELIKEQRVQTITLGRRRLVVYASLEKLIAE